MKIQRKLKRKSRKQKPRVSTNATQSLQINPAEIPPHLLDKIPPGLSLKPNAATIRQIAMQQMTRNCVYIKGLEKVHPSEYPPLKYEKLQIALFHVSKRSYSTECTFFLSLYYPKLSIFKKFKLWFKM